MNSLLKLVGTVFLFFITLVSVSAQKQEGTDLSVIEMADVMRSNGKIYVVVAVILVIFLGMVVYMVSLDKKLGKLENWKKDIENNSKK